MGGEKKTLLKNIFSVGLIQVANYIFPLITIPIVTRIIGPEKFGAINFIASFIAYFVLIIGFGFDITATRKISADPFNREKRNKLFSEVFTTQVMLLLLSTLIFMVCLFFVPQLRIERTVAVYTYLSCFATVLTQNWLFQAMQDLHKVAILSLMGKVMFTVIVLLTIHKQSDYYWQPLALSLSQIFVGIISFSWSVKKYKLQLYRVNISKCLQLLGEEKIFFFSLCFAALFSNTSIILLGTLGSVEEVGYYAAGQKLIMIVIAMSNLPLSQAFYPYIGKAFAESREKGLDIVRKLFPLVFGLMSLCGLLIFIFAPIFVNVFYGNKFHDAIIVCRILAFIPLLFSLSTILAVHVMLNLKMDKIFFKVAVTGPVVGLLLNFILLKINVMNANSIAYLFTEVINILLFDYYLRKEGIKIITIDNFRTFYSYKNWYIILKQIRKNKKIKDVFTF